MRIPRDQSESRTDHASCSDQCVPGREREPSRLLRTGRVDAKLFLAMYLVRSRKSGIEGEKWPGSCAARKLTTGSLSSTATIRERVFLPQRLGEGQLVKPRETGNVGLDREWVRIWRFLTCRRRMSQECHHNQLSPSVASRLHIGSGVDARGGPGGPAWLIQVRLLPGHSRRERKIAFSAAPLLAQCARSVAVAAFFIKSL
jgi:hypothetical protein